jgi:hypothetical protein
MFTKTINLTADEFVSRAVKTGNTFWIDADGVNYQIEVPAEAPRRIYRLDGDANGSITVTGDGPGDVWRTGIGYGNAHRDGAGYGHALRYGNGNGRAIHEGTGEGRAYRTDAS